MLHVDGQGLLSAQPGLSLLLHISPTRITLWFLPWLWQLHLLIHLATNVVQLQDHGVVQSHQSVSILDIDSAINDRTHSKCENGEVERYKYICIRTYLVARHDKCMTGCIQQRINCVVGVNSLPLTMLLRCMPVLLKAPT